MPAKSIKQRRLMAMCEHGVHTKEKCPDMTKSQMHDFASTSEKNLPKYAAQRATRNKRKPKV